MLKRHRCDQVTITTTWRKTAPSETKWRFFFFFICTCWGNLYLLDTGFPERNYHSSVFPMMGILGKSVSFAYLCPNWPDPVLTSIFLLKPAPNLFSTQVRDFPIDMITLCPPPTITNNDIYNLRHCERKISKDRACFTVRFIQHTQR